VEHDLWAPQITSCKVCGAELVRARLWPIVPLAMGYFALIGTSHTSRGRNFVRDAHFAFLVAGMDPLGHPGPPTPQFPGLSHSHWGLGAPARAGSLLPSGPRLAGHFESNV